MANQFQWSDCQKSIFARKCVDGTAKALLRTIRTQSWQQMREELLSEFVQTMSPGTVYKSLANRRKISSESAQQYIIAMREIAAMGQVQDVDVIGYIIDGIAHDKSEYLFLAAAKSFKELRTLLARLPTQYERSTTALPEKKTNPFSSRCFNCNEVGHCWRLNARRHDGSPVTAAAKRVISFHLARTVIAKAEWLPISTPVVIGDRLKMHQFKATSSSFQLPSTMTVISIQLGRTAIMMAGLLPTPIILTVIGDKLNVHRLIAISS